MLHEKSYDIAISKCVQHKELVPVDDKKGVDLFYTKDSDIFPTIKAENVSDIVCKVSLSIYKWHKNQLKETADNFLFTLFDELDVGYRGAWYLCWAEVYGFCSLFVNEIYLFETSMRIGTTSELIREGSHRIEATGFSGKFHLAKAYLEKRDKYLWLFKTRGTSGVISF